jgi:hypothetical protein
LKKKKFQGKSYLHGILIVEQEEINNLVLGPFGEEVINDNGEKLIDICEQNSLRLLNRYFKHNRIHNYT